MTDLLRPERMSKVSVTGSKAVMDDVIEAIHGMNLVHVSDYDGSWSGFSPGTPVEGADEVSEKLVTVRSLESILEVDEEHAGPTRLVTDEAIETELAEIRERVNELDDRRDDLENELRAVQERIDAMGPFASLGIDVDLLQGYDTLQVAVGEGSEAAVRDALGEVDELRAFELFTGDGVVAAFHVSNGTEIWNVTVSDDVTDIEVGPNGHVYHTLEPNTGYIRKIRASNGSQIWEVDPSGDSIRGIGVA
jgi:V/A-type H+-transporting ATPase subunit I